jgi:putative spermidine/putrescine transport system substrate-binding protein
MNTRTNQHRRSFLKTAGVAGALVFPSLWTASASAAGRLTVADNGGALTPVMKKAFYDPFTKETGIEIVAVAHESDPVTQFKLLVDSGSNIWDLCMVTPDHVARLVEGKNYLAPLDIAATDATTIIPGMLTSNWFGFSTYGVVMAYRTDRFPKGAPSSWKDFWDVEKFPGRRGLYKSPIGMFENALLADGVAGKDLYPVDVDRALKSLEKIRKNVSVWWSNGAQNTQLLQSGEVDLSDTWNARAIAAIVSGAPVKIVWEGTYNTDGWSIPVSTPNLKQAQQFVRFCMKAEQQAVYSSLIANGPSNTEAYKFIEPARAELLPTNPKNIERLTRRDAAWWGKNYDKVSERFEEWLLS